MIARLLVVVCAVSLASPLAAQITARDGVRIRLSGRVHPQYNSTSVTTEPRQQMLLRRARLTFDVSTGWLSARIEPDVGEGELSVKDAWVGFEMGGGLQVRLGQFKRPFDLFELTSSTQILVVERAGGIRGVSACDGVGGVCSFSRLTERLGYADRDIGVDASAAVGGFTITAAMTNGTGANTEDENGAKSFTGRITRRLGSLTLAANVGAHDYIHTVGGSDEYGIAFGGDLEYGRYDDGLHIQAGVVLGDNWAVPVGADGSAAFRTAQAIVTYAVPVAGTRLRGIEPLARLSWADPNSSVADDHGILVTPGINVLFGNRNRLAVNVDVWLPAVGDSEYSVKVQQFFYF